MYEAFKAIRQYLKDTEYNLGLDELLVPHKLRAAGEYKFTKKDHACGLIISILSANRPWIGIQQRLDDLREVFHDYDPEYLKSVDPQVLTDKVVAIGCGNRRIAKQMEEVAYNMSILDYYENKFGDVDAPMQMAVENPMEVLWTFSNSKSLLKFRGVAIALAAQYMKNLGIDIVKPDVHLRRIIERFGYSISLPDENETISICKSIAEDCGCSQTEVGTIMWQYCAVGYLETCGATPACHTCPANKDCLYGSQIKGSPYL